MANQLDEKHLNEDRPTYIENTDEAHESPIRKERTLGDDDLEKNSLTQELTLQDIDIENRNAFKGDDSDGKVTWNLRSILAACFLAALYTGSQIILYFVGGSVVFIAADLGIETGAGWLPTANILAIAAVAPYAGYLQDLFGKRYIALSVVPVKYRGYSLALVTAFVIPFCPYLMYVEMWSTHDTWRWGPWCSLIYNGTVGLGLLFTYFPQNHTRVEGFSRWAILKRIDYFGGFLSITGLTLFLVALQSGGYTHPWKGAYVLCTLIIGLLLIVAWIFYEAKFARHPMVPKELFTGQRIVALAYVIAFTAGMNFFSILNFFPTLFSAVYDNKPVQVGLKAIPPALSTTFGAISFNTALSAFPNRSREILLIALLFMTCFGGSLAASTPDNPKLTVALGTLAAFGVGGVLVPAATIAMIVTPDALITTAAALSLSIRTVGGSIGYSIYYNVFATKLDKKLPVEVAEWAIKAGLPTTSAEAFVGTFLTTPAKVTGIAGVNARIIAAATKGSQWAYAHSLKYVWFTSLAFGFMAIFCCIMLPSTKKYQTNRVAVQI